MTLAQAGSPITADMINRQYTLADATNTTITGAASLANLSTAYTIAGSDAAQFTSYRLTSWGTAAWTSQQKLTLGMALAGTVIGTQPAIASTAFSAAAVINWKLILELMCTSTGSSGTWSAVLSGWFAETANAELPGTAADNVVPIVGVTGTDVTQNTTIANSLAIQAMWGATGPSITCMNTMFERLAV